MESKRNSSGKGFSLIELLIVVAIILIIAAIAIPNLVRARISANEAAAVHSTRSITTGQIQYLSAYPAIGYATSLSNLGPPAAGCVSPTATFACLIDNGLASGTKEGYLFTAATDAATPNSTYQEGGKPQSQSSGNRSFCAVEDAVIRVSATDFASAVDGTACVNSFPVLGN